MQSVPKMTRARPVSRSSTATRQPSPWKGSVAYCCLIGGIAVRLSRKTAQSGGASNTTGSDVSGNYRFRDMSVRRSAEWATAVFPEDLIVSESRLDADDASMGG